MEIVIGITVLCLIAMFSDAWDKTSKEQEEKHKQKLAERQMKLEAKLEMERNHTYFTFFKKVLLPVSVFVFFFVLMPMLKGMN